MLDSKNPRAITSRANKCPATYGRECTHRNRDGCSSPLSSRIDTTQCTVFSVNREQGKNREPSYLRIISFEWPRGSDRNERLHVFSLRDSGINHRDYRWNWDFSDAEFERGSPFRLSSSPCLSLPLSVSFCRELQRCIDIEGWLNLKSTRIGCCVEEWCSLGGFHGDPWTF